jgi:malonate transporter and related proteins
MQAILAVTVPFFALVLCGWLAARARVLPEAAIPGLNAFVLFFALPCMLFRFGAATPIGELLNPTLLVVYGIAGLMIVALTIAVTIGPRVHLKDAAFGALVAAFPNTGFMGMPLMTALLGAAAAGPMMVTLLVDMFITSSVCLALAQLHGNAHLPLGARLRAALRGPIGNPQPWAIALGALSSVTGLALPAPMARMVELLAGAATPVALFTIGAVLWRAGQHAHTRTAAAQFVPVALIKLLVHPALVFALGWAAMTAGAPLSAFNLMVLTLAAALPSASNVSLLAERHGADTGRVARIIMSSTVLAFASFSALAWWLGAGAA